MNPATAELGFSALHWAALMAREAVREDGYHDHVAIMRMLLDAKADVDPRAMVRAFFRCAVEPSWRGVAG